jgi:hypothetical protein
MDGTTAIAIWGGITGTASVAFQGATHFRDRVRLHVGGGFSETEDEHVLWLSASNRGRQPTTITEAGFLVKNAAHFEVNGRKIISTAPLSIRWDDGNPILLRPGEMHRFAQTLIRWPEDIIHADAQLRPFVVDSHGRRSWGEPAPFLRMLLRRGWKPKGVVDTRLVEPFSEPLVAEPVSARWMVWRPKHERSPYSRDPDVDDEIKLSFRLTPRR